MRAITIEKSGDERVLRLTELPQPSPGPGEVRIRVVASAVNRADLMQARGLYPPPAGAPETLGLECAGAIAELGAGVDGFAVGDRVMALLAGGGYAEEAIVHAGSLISVPDDLPLEQAAALPEVFLTVFLNVFQLGGLAEGGTALVHGGGSGIGTAAIQLIRCSGAMSVVTAGSDEKCAQCLELGADVAVNYRSGDFVEAVSKHTSGRGADVVLDSIGAKYFEKNLASLALGGRLVLIGLMGGAQSEINLGLLLTRRLQVIGSTLRARPVAEKAAIVRGFVDRFGEALREGRIRPIIDRTLPLADAMEAHRVLQASEHFGKVVLVT